MSSEKLRLFFVLLFVAAAIYGLREYSFKTARKEKAEEFARKYIRLVQANDLQTAYYQETSERFRGIVNFEKYASDYGLAFRKLGQLRSYRTIGWYEPGMGHDYYQLDCEAEYTHDTGKLRFVLELEGESFKLAGFLVYGDHWEKLKETASE